MEPVAIAPVLRRRLFLAGATGLCAAGLFPVAAAGQDLRYFQIGTGTTGGTYFVIGGILANAISNPPGSRPCDRGGSCGVPGLIAVAQSTSGAVENVQAIRDRRMESGLVQADIMFAAYRGTSVFAGTGPFTELRAIASLYPETIHVVVRDRSDIAGPADLRGRRVALGEKGSGTLVTARAVLSAYGLSEKRLQPVYLGPGTAGDRLAAGDLDAFFIVGGFPLPAVADLAGRIPIRLLPLDTAHAQNLVRRLPFYSLAVIPAGAYPGVAVTPTLGVGAVWAVHGAIENDLVHGIVRALWHPDVRMLLDSGHPRGSEIRIETAVAGLPVPLHPGAERFYREAGFVPEIAALTPSEATVPIPQAKPSLNAASQ